MPKYSIEITGLYSGDIKVSVRSNEIITDEELAKIVDTMMGSFGIRGKEKVADFCMLLCATCAHYENVPHEVISIDLKSAKEQMEGQHEA